LGRGHEEMGKSIEDRAEVINTSCSKVALQVEEEYQVLPNHFILLHIFQRSWNYRLISCISCLLFAFIALKVKLCITGDWDCSVGVVTCYGLDGPGIESRWGDKIFCTSPDQLWCPPSLLCNGYLVFPRGKAARVWH